jgi:hypothetical protein
MGEEVLAVREETMGEVLAVRERERKLWQRYLQERRN